MKPPLVSFAARGLSLIELMVALTISCFLLLGITQVFVAGKTSYQLQSALSRMQESARFTLVDVQRSARMAGYMGAGSDLTRIESGNNFPNHLVEKGVAPAFPYRFERPIEVFDAKDTGDGAQPTPGTAGNWTPSLPADLAAVRPLKGSDILVLRSFSEESVPLAGFNPLTGTLLAANSKFPNGREFMAGGIYAVGNHRYADVFQAIGVAGTSLAAPYTGGGTPGNRYQYDAVNSPGLTWEGNREAQYGFRAGERWWNAELHRAVYVAYYVGLGSNGLPALMKQQLGENGSVRNDELIEGIESLQMLVSVNTSVPADDAPESYQTAAQLVGTTTDPAALDQLWRQVRSLQAGLLARCEEQFSTPRPNSATYTVLDQQMRRPDDRRLRGVYQTTVSLRNRVSNSQ